MLAKPESMFMTLRRPPYTGGQAQTGERPAASPCVVLSTALIGWGIVCELQLFVEIPPAHVVFLNSNFVRGPLAVVNSEDVIRNRLTVQTALVGVNYKFNWGR